MNDQCVAFELPDGRVLHSTCPVKSKRKGETKAQWLLRQFNKTILDTPKYAGATRIANPIMPDGTPLRPDLPKPFREAWRNAGGGQIVVDMPAARLLKMAQIRAKRNTFLADLSSVFSDAMYMRAQEVGNNALAAELGMKRQQLRDIPGSIDLASIATPEALEAFEPDWPTPPA